MKNDEKPSQVKPGDQGMEKQPGLPGDQESNPTSTAPLEMGLSAEQQEERDWLGRQPGEFHGLIAQHGRPLYQLVMQIGAVNHALGILQRQGRGNQAIQTAIHVLQKMVDEMGKAAIAREGKGLRDFMECKESVERIAALLHPSPVAPGGQGRSPGGILLDS